MVRARTARCTISPCASASVAACVKTMSELPWHTCGPADLFALSCAFRMARGTIHRSSKMSEALECANCALELAAATWYTARGTGVDVVEIQAQEVLDELCDDAQHRRCRCSATAAVDLPAFRRALLDTVEAITALTEADTPSIIGAMADSPDAVTLVHLDRARAALEFVAPL